MTFLTEQRTIKSVTFLTIKLAQWWLEVKKMEAYSNNGTSTLSEHEPVGVPMLLRDIRGSLTGLQISVGLAGMSTLSEGLLEHLGAPLFSLLRTSILPATRQI
jgi:hypothetical protein